MRPVQAVFVRSRMEAYTRRFGHEWTVVSPVPYFPKIPFKVNSLYGIYARMPLKENPWGYSIHHPRYLITPKLGMRFYGSWMTRGVRETILAIHKEKPIDVIDGHYIYPDGTAAIRMGAELGIPVVLSARGSDLNYYPSFPHIAPLIESNLAACNQLICVSNELRKVALSHGTKAEKISVIGNGIERTKFRLGDKATVRRELGLPKETNILLSVGRLDENKGLHIVLEACALLGRKDFILIAAGDGPRRPFLEALATSLGIGDRVKFVGNVSNDKLPAWYQAADLFVLASAREGWPNVLCEAQACGLPAVVTDAWGMSEIISDSNLGILVSERTSKGFCRALETALTTAWDGTAIARAGGTRTWELVADSLEEVFQRALGSSKSMASR